MSGSNTPDGLLNLPPRGEPSGGARVWLLRAVAGAAALGLIGIAAYVLVPTSLWWQQAGFDTDPGFFVRKDKIAYETCAAWNGWSERDVAARGTGGWTWASRSVSAGQLGETTNVGVLLPKDAVIDAVYCGSAPDGGATTECSMDGCDFPAAMSLDDDLYTRGRALKFSFEAQSADGRRGRVFHFWVKWRRG